MKVLSVQSSANLASSFSRQYSQKVLEQLKQRHPRLELIERDLVRSPVPTLDQITMNAFFTPADQRTPEMKSAIALSERLTDEFLAADIVVIGAPMYNFSLPAALKAWIDQIVRVGRTFKYGENGPIGLASDSKKVFVVMATGGAYSEGDAKRFDFEEGYLRTILGFMGVTSHVEVLRIERTAAGEEKRRPSIDQVNARILAL